MLPHAFPFHFLDSPPRAGHLRVCLTANATASRGGPYPPLLGMEILAQAAMAALAPAGNGSQGRLAGLDGGRCHRALVPGERLHARAQLIGRFGSLVKVRAHLDTEAGEPVMEADLLLALVE